MVEQNDMEDFEHKNLETINEKGFEEEQLGFPPYFTPFEGAKALCVVSGFDDSDPDFERWIFQAKTKIQCRKGPSDDAEVVIVKPGEFFSTSNYVQLRLHQYIGLEVLLYVKDKTDIGKGKTMWNWGLKVSPETKKLLNERRHALVQAKAPNGQLTTS